jgi:hypothetical protein
MAIYSGLIHLLSLARATHVGPIFSTHLVDLAPLTHSTHLTVS